MDIMAQCKLSPQEFIKNVFPPQIAVMCTAAVQESCDKNHLEFTDLLQPFSKLTNDVSYKDPNGVSTTLKSFKLSFMDVKVAPPHTSIARRLLNMSVSEALDPKMKTFDAKNYQLEIPSSTPWYESWRDTFLSMQYPSDHEFIKHFLGCLLVVSSNDTNPVESITQLSQSLDHLQNTTGIPPKWFNSIILKYYVILHDNMEGNLTVATKALENFKNSYGESNCFLLKINSRSAGSDNEEHLADPWSQFLNEKIDTKKYQTTSDILSDTKEQCPLEIGLEANEIQSLSYHPLSGQVDETESLHMDLEKDGILPKDSRKWGHGSCLSVDDVEQIKTMINDFTKMCLLPYIEKQLATLNDNIATKKGMSKSLLSATKRWFSTNKPNASSLASSNLIYATDSLELQIRKMGDLYFMFGNYSSAFQAYHSAKRDYNADQAWLYYAGALEMAALAAFMANESSRKTYDYMDESISTYLTICKVPQFATRATILSSECLKFKQLYGETAHQLIRMTSEDSDLRSALLLEQASYCFLQSNMLRKYAFHMVLSGHRYFKAGQKKHSLRCYKQAYQIYENTGWDLSNDHIHYTIGRLANNLQHYYESVESFSKLLTEDSKQSALQQSIFLKEYLTTLKAKLDKEESKETPSLPIPELDNSSIKVLVGPTRPLSTPGKVPAMGITFSTSNDSDSEDRWHKLEEMLLDETGAAPLIFKPMVTLYTASSMETNTLVAIINEPIQVSIQFTNSLQTALLLKEIYLLWRYEGEMGDISNLELNDNIDKYIKTYVTKVAIIPGNSKQDLVLSCTPLVTGNIHILGVCYTLNASSTNSDDSVSVKGKKMFNVSSDNNLLKPIRATIVPHAPCLQITFSEINLDFLAGELQNVSVNLQNTGSVSLRNIMMATSVPHLLSSLNHGNNQTKYTLNDEDLSQINEKLMRKNHISLIELPKSGQLDSGQSISIDMWVKAPDGKGPSQIDLLTYYENVNIQSIPRYRLIRHTWNLSVQESLSMDVSTQTSYNSSSTEDISLALKATNLNKIHNSISTEITLLNIALLSKNWILTKDIVTPAYVNLGSQESAHILIKARRKVSKKDKFSTIQLTSEKTDLSSTAFQDFAWKTHMPLVNIFDPKITNRKVDGTLFLEWRALVCDGSKRKIVSGQSHVTIQVNRKEWKLDKLIADTVIDLNSPFNSPEESYSEKAQNQVTYNLIYPTVVKHNFQKTRSCVVPVKLVLHNILAETVHVTVKTVNESPSAINNSLNKSYRPNLFASQATSNFCWLTNGKLLKTLDPLTTTSMALSLIVANPGTFDLGAYLGVFCNLLNKAGSPVLQMYEVPSSLIVIDSNS